MKKEKFHKNPPAKSKREAEKFIEDFCYTSKKNIKNISAREIKKIILEQYEERLERCNENNF